MRKLSKKIQKLLDELYPDGYKLVTTTLSKEGPIEVDESHLYHLLFYKIFETKGFENKVVPSIQKINAKDYQIMKGQLDKGWKLAAITGHDGFEIIHDPTGATESAEAEELAKQEAAEAEEREKEEAAAKAEEDRIAAEEAKKAEEVAEKERMIKEKAELEKAAKKLKAEKAELEKQLKAANSEKPKSKPGPKPKAEPANK